MKTTQTILIRNLIIIATVVNLSACQAPQESPSGWSSDSGEVRPGPTTSKAVLSLLSQARLASKQGSFSTAESHLERALRIEPRNPSLWLYMAKLRLYNEKNQEAISLAKKALVLSTKSKPSSFFSAADDEQLSLQADSWRVIAHAYQKLGNIIEAKRAQEKSRELTD